MVAIQERIREVDERCEYWEKERAELATMGKSEEIDDKLRKANSQLNICLEGWTILNDELNSTKEKGQIDGAEVLRPKLYSLKFYADGAEGVSDKLFCYPVHHGGHTADLLTRFIKSGLTIKAAYLVGGLSGEKGMQLGRGELEYLTCTGEKEKNRIRAILMSKFPKLG